MINLTQIQQASVAERIRIMELILQSLKKDIRPNYVLERASFKPFRARQFDLGHEVHVNRDAIYAERGINV